MLDSLEEKKQMRMYLFLQKSINLSVMEKLENDIMERTGYLGVNNLDEHGMQLIAENREIPFLMRMMKEREMEIVAIDEMLEAFEVKEAS